MDAPPDVQNPRGASGGCSFGVVVSLGSSSSLSLSHSCLVVMVLVHVPQVVALCFLSFSALNLKLNLLQRDSPAEKRTLLFACEI